MRNTKQISKLLLGVIAAALVVVMLASVTSHRVPSRDDRSSGTQERVEVNK